MAATSHNGSRPRAHTCEARAQRRAPAQTGCGSYALRHTFALEAHCHPDSDQNPPANPPRP